MRSTLATIRWVAEQLSFQVNVVELADFVVMEMDEADRVKWMQFLWARPFSPQVSQVIENVLVITGWNSWRKRVIMIFPKRSEER